MSGHSKWKQIRHKKAVTDQKKSQVFSKLLGAITTAARKDSNPELNPDLKKAVERAREANVPRENIERAIERVGLSGNLRELLVEAYGPGGVAVLVISETDNKNRTVQEIKSILKDHGGKWADPGSVVWAFKKQRDGASWTAKFPQELDELDRQKVVRLVTALKAHDDIREVYTNT